MTGFNFYKESGGGGGGGGRGGGGGHFEQASLWFPCNANCRYVIDSKIKIVCLLDF